MTIITLPDLGEGLTEATIRAWHVKAGQTVQADSVLVTVETAKSLVDIPCPQDGIISVLHAEEGSTLEVGSALASYAQDETEEEAITPLQTTKKPPPYKIHPHARKLAENKSEAELTALSQKHGLITPDLLKASAPSHKIERNIGFVIDHIPLAKPTAKKILPHFISALVHFTQRPSPLQAANIALAVNDDDRTHIVCPDWPTSIKDITTLLTKVKKQCKEKRHIPHEWQREAQILISNFGSIAGRYGSPKLLSSNAIAIGMGKIFVENNHPTLPLTLIFDHNTLSGREVLLLLQSLQASLAANSSS